MNDTFTVGITVGFLSMWFLLIHSDERFGTWHGHAGGRLISG